MVEPACKYFGVCGGCQNQHIAYEQQLENKQKRLAYLLAQHYTGDINVFAVTPYEYRNRMDFITSQHVIGFRQQDPKKLVDVDHCPISEPRLNALLTELRTWLQQQHLETFDPKKKSGVLKYAVIRIADESAISFMLNEDSSKLTAHVEAIKQFAQHTTANHVIISYSTATSDESVSLECFAVKGEEYLKATLCGKTLYYHSQGFFQNNTAVAELMINRARALITQYNPQDKMVVDAYGGVGTFGVVLAADCKEVVSVEAFPGATDAAQKNIRINNIQNMRAINEDAGNMKKIDVPADAIFLLDPPRSGLGEKMVRYLLEKKPSVIVYVSCNPTELAKELLQLTKYYTVKSADLFDMFPQTNHIEAVVLLERKSL
jgi:23S rRNA (uracil-5-)-methyltransferase RumA